MKRLYLLVFYQLFFASGFSAQRSTPPQLCNGDNFHVVEADIVQANKKGKMSIFRSAQLEASTLGECIDYYKIKMVINFRKKSEDPETYDAEEKMCKDKKISFFNIPMESVPIEGRNLPSQEQVQSLLSRYELALLLNLSILIHCYAGIDRTGLAAALWVFQRLLKGLSEEGPVYQTMPEEQDCKQCYIAEARRKALEQLTSKHGSINPEPAKVFFIKIWQGKEWFEEFYKPETYQAPYKRYIDRYRADECLCEYMCCCCNGCAVLCNFYCGCPRLPCFCTSCYWKEQFGKRNICDEFGNLSICSE